MIAAVALSLALMSSEGAPGRPQVLGPEAACRLARQERIPRREVYSIAGTYVYEEPGSTIELPGCGEVLFALPDIDTHERIQKYHWALRAKCRRHLGGDHFSGVFTGRFVRTKAHVARMRSARMINFFMVSHIESRGLDVASITCGK